MTMGTESCVVIVLTFNSANIIGETLTQARKVCQKIFVVDSGSTDGTTDIALSMGCNVVHRAFTNYSDQRNWAIEQMVPLYHWQLHLDADEVLDDVAIAAIRGVLSENRQGDAYLLRRRDYFMGRMLRFSGLNPWHLRLFRSGVAQCENRLYDQHFVTTKKVVKLTGFMHDKNALRLSDWIARHNRWSDLEAEEIMASNLSTLGVLQSRLFGDARERTRFLKNLYYRLPRGLRVLLYFTFRYFVRLGFLDGVPGFYFAFFQAFWFRMLVDAKIYEARSA